MFGHAWTEGRFSPKAARIERAGVVYLATSGLSIYLFILYIYDRGSFRYYFVTVSAGSLFKKQLYSNSIHLIN